MQGFVDQDDQAFLTFDLGSGRLDFLIDTGFNGALLVPGGLTRRAQPSVRPPPAGSRLPSPSIPPPSSFILHPSSFVAQHPAAERKRDLLLNHRQQSRMLLVLAVRIHRRAPPTPLALPSGPVHPSISRSRILALVFVACASPYGCAANRPRGT